MLHFEVMKNSNYFLPVFGCKTLVACNSVVCTSMAWVRSNKNHEENLAVKNVRMKLCIIIGWYRNKQVRNVDEHNDWPIQSNSDYTFEVHVPSVHFAAFFGFYNTITILISFVPKVAKTVIYFNEKWLQHISSRQSSVNNCYCR